MIVLHDDPNVSIELLDLLMASKAAGYTGVRNEMMSICDELLRQNVSMWSINPITKKLLLLQKC